MNPPGARIKPRVLVAPLDWGLGHATRMIPVIRELLKQECEVLLAGSGKVAALLKQEFPLLTLLELEGYDIVYAGSRHLLALQMLMQLPKISESIRAENKWLKRVIKTYNIDAVISDNRYGLYNEQIKNVIVTHQLQIQTPFAATTLALRKINYAYINKFNECWIPDFESADGLSGKLSHVNELPSVPVYYLGPLSRFYRKTVPLSNTILIVLSGPEPQRTLLEEELLIQVNDIEEDVVLIRGLPGENAVIDNRPNVKVYNHLSSGELETLMQQAKIVISRSGYSTVMDLAVLGKKSILIPTPGQTEQEYLGQYLMEQNLALCIPQQQFKLKQALYLANNFMYKEYSMNATTGLANVITTFVDKLRAGSELAI